MAQIEIRPLSVLKLSDPGKLWNFRKRKIMPAPVDVIVLHPNLPAVFRKEDQPTYVALHATLADIDYICRIATLSDQQIESAQMGEYTQEQVQAWLTLGYEMPPYLKDVVMAMASSQLKFAIEEEKSRVINR